MSFISLIIGSFRNYKAAKGIFVETESYEKGFSDYYEKNLKPHIQSYEEARLHALKSSSTHARISIFIAIVILALDYFIIDSFKLTEKIVMSLIFGNFLGFGMLYFWIYALIDEYKLLVKSKIFPNIVLFCGPYKYRPQCTCLITREIKNSGIIPIYDEEISRDKISGDYNGVEISLFHSRLKFYNNRRSGASVRGIPNIPLNKTLFNGIIIWCNVHKNFKGKTLIKKDFGKIGNFFKSKPDGLEAVKLEDPKFEEMFEVYSSDQVEARYLLTTSFMERLLNLNEFFGGKAIECSFYENKLLMMISTNKKWLETGSIYESEDFTDDAKIVLGSMNTIFEIIDDLKLSQNIGM